MSFIADKQTLEDLNLLGKYKQHSVFTLFNKTSTAGGEKLLGEMFQNPLTDPETINKRSEIFKYFQDKQIEFPFSNAQFGQMENYLSRESKSSYPATLISLTKKKLLATIIKDEEYPNIENGLQQTIALLYEFRIFISQLEGKEEHPILAKLQAVKNILNEARLKVIAQPTITTKLSLLKIASYDYLLRHTMKQGLQNVMETFYQLDVFISVANIAKEKNFGYAKALSKVSNVLKATALRHPNIDKAITNPVTLNSDSNLIFLTGANMAGKSTFMKAFGVNIYLAHLGFPVAAAEITFSVKDGIYSSINVPDNLNMGYSHFYAEVLRVKKVAEEVNSGKDLVIIFDELFKGTNVKDAYDATLAVTAAFSEYRNCLFIISTHIIEAAEVLKEQNNIQSLFLPTIMNGNIPSYTYQLQPGISADRHGMMIIENEGILQLLESE